MLAKNTGIWQGGIHISFTPFQRIFFILITLAFMILGASPVYAEKTDVVVLRNGDRITGEIKELRRGMLKYKTDDMSTIYIEWDKITQITSKHVFEVEMRSGQRIFGSLIETSEKYTVVVQTVMAPVPVDLIQVVGLTPIKASFFSRLDGSLDVGFSYTKANALTTWTGSGEVKYRTKNYSFNLNGSTYYSNQRDADSTSRNNIGFIGRRFFSRRWYILGLAQAEQNEELNLDYRTITGGGAGRGLVQTNRLIFTVFGGVVFTREKYTDESDATRSGEAVGGTTFELFKYDTPKVDLSANFFVIPSLTLLGRVRLNSDAKLRFELFKDFFWAFSYFATYDSQPPTKDTEKSDYGVTTSLGWSF